MSGRAAKAVFAFGACAVLMATLGARDGEAFLEKFKKKGPKAPAQEQTAPAAQPESDLQRRYDELKKDYAALEADRQNILEQTKHLFSVRSELTQTQEAQGKLEKILASLTKRNRRLHDLQRRQKQEVRNILKYNEQVESAYGEILPKYDQLMNENAQLSVALLEKVDQSPEYKRMAQEVENMRRQVTARDAEAARLAGEMNEMQKRTAILKNSEEKLIADLEAKTDMLTNLRAERQSLVEINADLAHQLEEMPKKVENLAKQNHLLLRETADMHYNMGVFFIQNRNYTRALAEFERALEFDPESPKVHYNLGYLYAEQLREHERAMYHFRKYLTLEPQSEKTGAVKDYLLVRQTMGDKPYVDKIAKLQKVRD